MISSTAVSGGRVARLDHQRCAQVLRASTTVVGRRPFEFVGLTDGRGCNRRSFKSSKPSAAVSNSPAWNSSSVAIAVVSGQCSDTSARVHQFVARIADARVCRSWFGNPSPAEEFDEGTQQILDVSGRAGWFAVPATEVPFRELQEEQRQVVDRQR